MFFYQLGRFGEAKTIDHYAAHSKDASELRSILYKSEERKIKGISPQAPGKFMAFRENSKKMLVLGNCQASNIARQIAAATDLSVLGMEVMNYQSEKDIFLELIESVDYIACCLLSPNFEEIATQNLRKRDDLNILFYCPMFFDGIHPDIVYWGGMGQRVASGAGDYHSRLVLNSYFAEKSEKECLDILNVNTYQNIGYFDEFDHSFKEMERREQGCDIAFRPFLLENIRQKNCFLTVNHPTQLFLNHMSAEICRYFDIDFQKTDYNAVHSTLAAGPQWPIVPEIIEHFNLAYSNGNSFQIQGSVMGWEEFIARSYILYDQIGRDKLWSMGNEGQKLILKRGLNA
ncbi:MAG: hypothetical protein CFE31_09915 [Rhizobiales bacterium PAR1]|nr:MAG: hypothetical protein CFE31_09915 [Rhizobiales bacterium PAR1]